MDFNNQDIQKNIGDAEEDRISELPDSILHYILSFVDIKHAARSCVLSKRWKHIWTSIPTLDLRFWELHKETPSLSEINKFMDFVDRTLDLHDTSSNIQTFKLNLYNDMNASRVHSWIENLTRRNVQELSLDVNLDLKQGYIHLSIPLSLFNCESLTKLELAASPTICFPENIFCPKLKSLTLWNINFGNGYWNDQPFSNCPVLENLILGNCTWFGLTKFYIITPVLKVLEIGYLTDDDGLADCDLRIHAPSLGYLGWCSCVAKDYEMSSFLTLDKAKVVFYCFGSGRKEAVNKFLRALSHVRCLSLYVEIDQVLPVVDGFLSNPPAYHNLNRLELYYGATADILIFSFLKAAPNLNYLAFYEFYHSPDHIDEKEYDEIEDLFPHLQTVCFGAFSGRTRRQLRWVELILKNAKSLQTMTITYDTFYYNVSMQKSKEAVTSEVLSFTRASERCMVKFVGDELRNSEPPATAMIQHTMTRMKTIITMKTVTTMNEFVVTLGVLRFSETDQECPVSFCY